MNGGAHDRTDGLLRGLSAVVGGPPGARAAGHPWWGPGRVLLATTTGVLAVGMAGRSACVPTAWSGQDQPRAELCWTELAGVSASQEGPGAVADHLGGWAERAGSVLAPDAPPALAAAALLAVLLAAVALAVTRLLSTADAARPWAAAGWAAAPLLAAHWLSWDLLAAAGVALLLLAWTRSRWGIGLLGLLLVAAFAHPLVAVRGPDTGSVWLLVAQAADTAVPAGVRLGVTLVAIAAACAAAYVVGRRRGPGDVAAASRAGLVVLGVLLLVAPSAPPEAALLLLPLAAFAVPRWRDHLVWQSCELLSWVITGWHLGGALTPTAGGDSRVYWLAVLLRLVGTGWLVAAALRAGMRPPSADHDAVEAGRREPHPHVDLLTDAGHARA